MMSMMIDATSKAFKDGFDRGMTEAVSLFASILKTGDHRQKLDCVDTGCFGLDDCKKCICSENYWDNLAEDIALRVKRELAGNGIKRKAV